MSTVAYKQTALSWSPAQRSDRAFALLASLVLALLLGAALVLSSIELPERPREQRGVPQRIVQFVEQRPKPRPEPPKQEPVQVKPEPEPLTVLEPVIEEPPDIEPPQPEEVEPQPVRKQQPREALTEAQQQVRDRVRDKGLLAERQGFADILDTSGLTELVAQHGDISTSAEATQAAGVDTQALLASAGQGSGGVEHQAHSAALGESRLAEQADATSNISPLVVNDIQNDQGEEAQVTAREEEDLKLVFDQNKSTLHTLYNRERRKHPGLKGRIVLELTIDELGKVMSVTIVSSELNNAALERRLVARVKQFDFGPSPLGTITVTYPIEFLPS